MNANMHPQTRQIWVAYTDCEGGTHTTDHFVWDSEAFLAARKKECDAANAKFQSEHKKPGLACVMQVANPKG